MALSPLGKRKFAVMRADWHCAGNMPPAAVAGTALAVGAGGLETVTMPTVRMARASCTVLILRRVFDAEGCGTEPRSRRAKGNPSSCSMNESGRGSVQV